MSDKRYFAANLERDLLGDLVVRVAYGGRWSRQGNVRVVPVRDEVEGARVLEEISKVRRRHGYQLQP